MVMQNPKNRTDILKDVLVRNVRNIEREQVFNMPCIICEQQEDNDDKKKYVCQECYDDNEEIRWYSERFIFFLSFFFVLEIIFF